MKKISPAMIMASLSVLASHAALATSSQPVLVIDSSSASSEMLSEMDSKFGLRSVDSMISALAPNFVDKIMVDGEVIDVEAYLAARDDTASKGKQGAASCYTNCHNACHGSRSWR